MTLPIGPPTALIIGTAVAISPTEIGQGVIAAFVIIAYFLNRRKTEQIHTLVNSHMLALETEIQALKIALEHEEKRTDAALGLERKK
jgi:hypothetical protein